MNGLKETWINKTYSQTPLLHLFHEGNKQVVFTTGFDVLFQITCL